MSLLGRLAHDAIASHEGVVAKARTQLDKELQPVATGQYVWRMVPVAQLVGTGEQMSESLRSLIGGGNMRVDRVLYAEVPTAKGALEVAVPFSGKDTLAPQFSLRLSVRAAAGAMLERSAMGSWGFGNWAPSRGFGGSDVAQTLCERMEAADISNGVEWNCELPGDYVWKLSWTLQLVPSGPGQSRLLMQSGRVGILFTRFGVDVFMKKAEQSMTVLQGLSEHPEAAPGEIEECWADRVAPLIAQQPDLGLGPAPGAPGASSSAPMPTHLGGNRPSAALPEDPAAKLKTRGTVALVLSAVALPMCCAPLGLVGGGLALHARSEAAKQGLTPPGTTLAALILSVVSVLFFGAAVVVGVMAPKTPKGAASSGASLNDDDSLDDLLDGEGAQVQVPIGGDADEQPRTGFRITRVYEKHQASKTAPFHAAGGDWTYFDAELDDDKSCAFTMGVGPSKDAGGFGFGKAALSVKDGYAADCLVDNLAIDFLVDTPPLREGPVSGPLSLATAVLGQNVARSKHGGFSGKGNWVATKLFFEQGDEAAEVFFNFDLKSRRGEFAEKDLDYNQPLVDILASSLRAEAGAAPGKKVSVTRPAKPGKGKR